MPASAHVTNGSSGGMMSTVGLELPYQRVSKAKFRDETSRRVSNVTFVKRNYANIRFTCSSCLEDM